MQVGFDAGGKTHALRYGMNAMVRYQRAAGGETMQAAAARLADRGDDVDTDTVRRMFWAGLVGTYSEEEAGDLMDEVGVQRAAELMSEAMASASDQENPTRGRTTR